MAKGTNGKEKAKAKTKTAPAKVLELTKDASKDGVIHTLVSNTARSEDDVVAAAGIDLTIWEVERCVYNKWDCVAKTATEKVAADRWQRELSAVELWQVKLWLKRRMPKYVTDAIDRRYDNFTFKPIKYSVLPNIDKHLMEVSLYDAHFGKLCWAPETGDTQNLATSKQYYLKAIQKLLTRAAGYPIDRILFPVGNDFFHVNNWLNTTAKGTIQDTDSRLAKIFEVGLDAIIEAVNRCLQVAPVDILWVPGNHDPETSWFLAKCLEGHYRTIDEVRVNKDPMWRKYVAYGKNLLGYTHGNEEKEADLPNLMAVEQPQLWAQCPYRGWRLGHFHTKRQRVYTKGDTINGVSVDYLPSLSGTDAWHFRKGYVGNPKAAEAWLWSADEGCVAEFFARV